MPYKTKDITGRRFSKLVVVVFSHRDEQGTSYWDCLCDCGGHITTRYASLTTGNTRSCGCAQKESARKTIKEQTARRTLPVGVAAQRDLFRQYKRAALKRGLAFNLTFERFIALTLGRCHYCGVEPRQIHTNVHWNGGYTYNGVDRVNNQVGYTPANAVSCCRRCNVAKMDTSEEDFLEHVRRICLHRGLHPVNDAKGNAEAMLHMKDQLGLKVSWD